MNSILKVGNRNNIQVSGRRYNLSKLISESYQTLYNCELDSKLYRLTESHINSIKNHPEALSLHSKNLEVLKGLVSLGESVKIKESDIPVVDELEDEDVIKEDAELEVEADADVLDEDADMEELEDEDVINEDADMEELEDEDVINEDSDMEELDGADVIDEDADMEELEGADVINEEDEVDMEDEESTDITPEELSELKKHLKEIRRARRTRESEEPDLNDPELAECPDRMKKTGSFPESRTWRSEKASMTKALKNFRESSNKKAFYKSFKKLHESMKSGNALTLEESILLYKASNSAMTHLTVELEHNPGFIYTFRECTSMLANDNAKLLECIRKQVSPSKSLVESYRDFSSILLESEDFEDEVVEEEEDAILSDEEMDEVAPAVAAGLGAAAVGAIDRVKSVDLGKNGVSATFKDSEEIPEEEEELQEESEESEEFEEEIPAPEEEVEESDEITAEEEIPEEEIELEEEVPSDEIPEEEVPTEEEIELEEDELDDEITDEEAEELKNKLMELRKSRKK